MILVLHVQCVEEHQIKLLQDRKKPQNVELPVIVILICDVIFTMVLSILLAPHCNEIELQLSAIKFKVEVRHCIKKGSGMLLCALYDPQVSLASRQN